MNGLNFKQITENHLEVLKLLVCIGKGWKGEIVDLAKNIGSKNTIYHLLDTLSQYNMVYLPKEKTNKKRRSGRPRKYYAPTVQGLVFALSNFPELMEEIDKIAEKNKEVMPLIFGKWQFFYKHGVIDIIKERLIRAIDYYRRSLNSNELFLHFYYWSLMEKLNEVFKLTELEESEIKKLKEEEVGDPRHYIINSVFGFIYYNVSPETKVIDLNEQINLIKVIVKDDDLLFLFSSMLEDKIKYIRNQLKELYKWEKVIENSIIGNTF
jgi:hypothetical protein